MIDATFVEVPRQKNNREENSQIKNLSLNNNNPSKHNQTSRKAM